MTSPPPFSPLLVTCPGAYADSGLGTGGFVLMHKGNDHIIDRSDTTGIWQDGELVLRFSRTLHTVTGVDRDGVRLVIKLPEARDVHDIAVYDDHILCVCSGSNEVLYFDRAGNLVDRWSAPGEGDAWHLNCLWFEGGRTYLSAFGDFREHRGWAGGCRETGFIFDLESGERVVGGLSGPHNPRYLDGAWLVCDSHTRSLVRVAADGSRQQVQLDAFTRGLAFDAHYLYVGESANRKAPEPPESSTIAVLNRQTLEVVDRLTVPFPEVYEILLAPPEMADRMADRPEQYTLNTTNERISVLEGQARRGESEVRRLTAELQRYQGSLPHRVLRKLLGG